MPSALGPIELLAGIGRRGVARLVDALIGGALALAVAGLVPVDRPVARLVVVVVALTAYEYVGTLAAGSPGKRIARIRVLEVDRDRVAPLSNLRRGGAVAVGEVGVVGLPIVVLTGGLDNGTRGLLALALLALAGTWVLSTLVGELRRGIPDRWAGTVVAHDAVEGVLTSIDLERLDPPEPEELTRWGPSVPGRERVRARFSRLDDAPLLLIGLGALALSASVVSGGGAEWWQVGLAVAWVVLFVADETWRVARTGTTAGHRRIGAAIVDEATGEAPGPLRSLARASVIGVACYAPVIQLVGVPVLVTWMRLSPSNRGLHDVLAGTLVVRVR